nr:uncharacterized protein LOC119180817 [Rhipicephalus microplus]
MHVLISGVPLLLLAAAANAIPLDLVPANQSSGGVVYEVHATITLESPELNVDEGTKLQYAGDLAVYAVGKDTYQARFLNFSMVTSTKTACPGCSLETLIIAPPERRYPPPKAVNDPDKSQVRPLVLETLIIAPPERRYPPLTAVNNADQSQVRPPVQETLIIAPPERRYPPLRAVNDADQSQVRPPVLETLIIAPPERRYPQLATVNNPDQSQVRPPVLETLIIAPPERTSPLRAVNDPDKSQVRPLVLETLIIAPPERRYPPLTAVNDADQSHVRPPILETLIIAPPERCYQPPTTIGDADPSQLLGYPVQFVLKSGKVVEYKMSFGAPAWINSVYQTVLALLQNQVETPLELPAVSSYYEDGVSGYCRVTYEVHSLTDLPTETGLIT